MCPPLFVWLSRIIIEKFNFTYLNGEQVRGRNVTIRENVVCLCNGVNVGGETGSGLNDVVSSQMQHLNFLFNWDVKRTKINNKKRQGLAYI